jgi:cell division protein FtsI (penicillin-binding protein 3)/stage V sporulation protein D (sporulation-specific penicillin-binding protein)
MLSISRIPMGHEVAVTPLQMVMAMGAVANGGSLMMPQIVHEVVDADGEAVASYGPQRVRTVASRDAIKGVHDALVQVVSPRGTARLAAVAGYKVAGKTGTAQKYGKDGRPVRDRHRLSATCLRKRPVCLFGDA